MIPDQARLWAQDGDIPVYAGNATWSVIDWDTRKWYFVEGPTEVFGVDEEGEETCKALLPFVDDLGPNVTKVVMSAKKELVSVSTDPKDDMTPFIYYPLFTAEEVPMEDSLDFLNRSDLTEIDRLAVCVDLVKPKLPQHESTLLVFKYEMLQDNLDRLWHEAFITKRLRRCPHVVPFHKFILDDVEPRFLGFTVGFVPGGNLFDNRRPIEKDWILQLLSFVDNINLNYGIVHQDIAPRNLLIDSKTGMLTVIDFGLATPIGSERENKMRNDIDGVIYTVYEILTSDYHYRWDVHPDDYNIEEVISKAEWPVKAELEPGLNGSTLRSLVLTWAEGRRRREGDGKAESAKPGEGLKIPKMPSTKVAKVIIDGEHFEEAETYPLRTQVSTGERIVRWERSPQRKKGIKRPRKDSDSQSE